MVGMGRNVLEKIPLKQDCTHVYKIAQLTYQIYLIREKKTLVGL